MILFEIGKIRDDEDHNNCNDGEYRHGREGRHGCGNCNDRDDYQDCDNFDKLNIDILLLTERMRKLKKKIRDTPWYHFLKHIALAKEMKDIEKDIENIEKRFTLLFDNPIQIVRRP